MRALRSPLPLLALGLGLAGCSDFDFDLRDLGGGFDTSKAAAAAVADKPKPDANGVLSYPNYQVAVARRGDTLASLAARVGADAKALSRHNGIDANTKLREGEIVALPKRVAAVSQETIQKSDVAQSLTPTAIDVTPLAPAPTTGDSDVAEPLRHKVEAGETAFTIARLYDVPVRDLSDWNGLGPDLAVREGQFLLVPVKTSGASGDVTKPGQGSVTPIPPSSARPQPREDAAPGSASTAPTVASAAASGTAAAATAAANAAKPPSPNLEKEASAPKSEAIMVFPASGNIIRAYKKGKNEGIDIGAPAGASVKAAMAGTVAAVTKDTNGISILVLKHDNGLLTVYTNIDNVAVKKGDKVGKGQTIAKVRKAATPFVHFEVRKGLESVDPMRYLS